MANKGFSLIVAGALCLAGIGHAREAELSLDQKIKNEQARIAKEDLTLSKVGTAHDPARVRKTTGWKGEDARPYVSDSLAAEAAFLYAAVSEEYGQASRTQTNAAARYGLLVSIQTSMPKSFVGRGALDDIDDAHKALGDATSAAAELSIRKTALYLMLIDMGWAVRNESRPESLEFRIQEGADYHRG